MRSLSGDRFPATLLLAAVAAMVVALGHPPAAHSATESPPGDCGGQEGQSARVAGDSGGGGEEDEGAAPTFSAGFYRRTFTIDASLDGLDGRELPVSIEGVCNVPETYAKQADQLEGTDGVALLVARPSIWTDRVRLQGVAAEAALEGADTAALRVRLAPRRQWREDEDGTPVPTFATRRIDITD
jgi:hypothetical protein